MKRIWRALIAFALSLFAKPNKKEEELRYPIEPIEPENVNYPEAGIPVLNTDQRIFYDPPPVDQEKILIDILKAAGIGYVKVLASEEVAERLEDKSVTSEEECVAVPYIEVDLDPEGLPYLSKEEFDSHSTAAELLDSEILKNHSLQKETVTEVAEESNEEPFNVQTEEVMPHMMTKPRKRLHWTVTDKDGNHVYIGTGFPEFIKEKGLDIDYKKAYRFSKNKNRKERLFKGKYKFVVKEQE